MKPHSALNPHREGKTVPIVASTESDWPVTLQCVPCDVSPDHWYAKAALMAETATGKRFPIFGFGCDIDREQAEASAYHECLEHYLGSAYAYGAKQLNARCPVFDLQGQRQARGRRRRDLLADRQTGGWRQNGTGMAIHTDVARAAEHARMEILERHISYLWWHGGLGVLDLCEAANMPGETMFGVVETDGVAYALSLFWSSSPPLFAIGSACASSVSEAVSRARRERVMACQSAFEIRGRLEAGAWLSRSTNGLTDLMNADRVAQLARELRHKKHKLDHSALDQLRPVLDEHEFTYAVIHEQPALCLVRGMIDNTKDASSREDADCRQGPFL